MAKATTSKTEKKMTKTETANLKNELTKELSSQKQNTQVIRKRVSSLVDELFVLKGELDTFKRQVTKDMSQVVDGLQNLAKNQKNK
jgi:hypothetical protein|tara:strand:- start:459 stop:716 length:258 start_codon:yes stop_codon:yes gene_type:complete